MANEEEIDRTRVIVGPPKKESEDILDFFKVPWASWIMSAVFGACFWYMIFHFVSKDPRGKIFVNEDSITWWQILLTIFLFFMSIIFLYSGKIHLVTINRRYGFIKKERTTITCKKTT